METVDVDVNVPGRHLYPPHHLLRSWLLDYRVLIVVWEIHESLKRQVMVVEVGRPHRPSPQKGHSQGRYQT